MLCVPLFADRRQSTVTTIALLQLPTLNTPKSIRQDHLLTIVPSEFGEDLTGTKGGLGYMVFVLWGDMDLTAQYLRADCIFVTSSAEY